MNRRRVTPSFKGLRPASKAASAAAQGASRKANTRCELVLRRALSLRGLRYRLNHTGLPGRPDIVFPKYRLLIFCDGDFWHGRNLQLRLDKLARGHNAAYWIAKIRRNAERDRRQTHTLETSGWTVLRFWETEVLQQIEEVVERVVIVLNRLRTESQQLRRAKMGTTAKPQSTIAPGH